MAHYLLLIHNMKRLLLIIIFSLSSTTAISAEVGMGRIEQLPENSVKFMEYYRSDGRYEVFALPKFKAVRNKQCDDLESGKLKSINTENLG